MGDTTTGLFDGQRKDIFDAQLGCKSDSCHTYCATEFVAI